MKKLLRFSAMLAGTAAVILGISSCNKDNNSIECCAWTFEDDDESYSYTVKACEDGSINYTYSYNGETHTVKYNWHEDFDSWTEMKDIILEEYFVSEATCY